MGSDIHLNYIHFLNSSPNFPHLLTFFLCNDGEQLVNVFRGAKRQLKSRGMIILLMTID